MMFKPFYHHYHPWAPGKLPSSYTRGFTVYVSPCPDNHKEVFVQGTWCSAKDEFNKKLGRSFAEGADKVRIEVRRLPELLASMANTVYQEDEKQPNDYFWVWKYIV